LIVSEAMPLKSIINYKKREKKNLNDLYFSIISEHLQIGDLKEHEKMQLLNLFQN
jgi:hypothetical protein